MPGTLELLPHVEFTGFQVDLVPGEAEDEHQDESGVQCLASMPG
jgi:hypothetical protein